MPIANCFIHFDVPAKLENGAQDIISLWAEKAGVPSAEQHMTINFVKVMAQHGNRYPIMVWLYLPTLWSEPDVVSLQSSLSSILTQELGERDSDVHVVTIKIDSGHVVESGQVVKW